MRTLSARAAPDLSVRLPNVLNGQRVCIRGTIRETSQCLTQPAIEVTMVRPPSSCP